MTDDDEVGMTDDMTDDDVDELVQRADLDGLVRLIDARCEHRDWDGLRRVRDRSRAAVATGRQLWPAATLAEYRLALLAPAPWAVGALADDTGRFTIGPLSEVIAQHHTWPELAPELHARADDVGLRARFVAHERALRGDTVDEAELTEFPAVIEIPAGPRPWEPVYPVATYHDDGGEFPAPDVAPVVARAGPVTELPATGAGVVDDPDVDAAVRHLVEAWWVEGNGHAETVCVEGDAAGALAALGLRRARTTRLDAADALAWLAWAGASGGGHGRRRGAAAGRDGAWWVLGALGELHDEWPPDDEAVADLLADLRWWWWDADEPTTGWSLRLVVEDVANGVAWAFNAGDAA